MKTKISLLISQAGFLVLLVLVFLPGNKDTKGPLPFVSAIIIMEALYIITVFRNREKLLAASDIMVILWGFLIVWEVLVTKLNLAHPVLIPAPENVFYVFYERPLEILLGVFSSLKLLFGGIILGLAGGIILGLICAWIKRLRDIFYPIANVLAPIPTIVFSPYVVALMPSFRSASYVVIILGIFWPTFLQMIVRVDSMDKGIMNTAKSLNLSNGAMIFKVLLPYAIPGIVGGLKITLTTSVMMLTFAEMMGATTGMGYFIVNYNTYGNYTNVVAGLIVVAIVVTILNRLVVLLQKKLIRWEMY